MTELTGSSESIRIGETGCFLTAPGWQGVVEAVDLGERNFRDDSGLYNQRLRQAFSQAEMTIDFMFELEITDDGASTVAETVWRSGDTAVTREDEPAVMLSVPDYGEGVGYAVLYTDEAQLSRWLLPAPRRGGEAMRGGDGGVNFYLPRAGAPLAPNAIGDGEPERGPISKIGRRVVRVLTWLTDSFVGKTALNLAFDWEIKHRPAGVFAVDSEVFAVGPDKSIHQEINWRLFSQGRGLLLIHGTFSTFEGAFAKIHPATMETLAHRYGRRILAFNHPSLYPSPLENAQTFLELLPPNTALDLDILTHSRGGLVGRELIERVTQPLADGRKVKVSRAIFVGVPHQGTILADGDHALDFLDRYTNFLTNLPDQPAYLTCEAVFALVKILLHGGLAGLPGLQSMLPQGEYLRDLNKNRPHATQYYAITANYTPTDQAWLKWMTKKAGDMVIDRIFGEANDGVVPTLGGYNAGEQTCQFPIPAERLTLYSGKDQLHHCNYFEHAGVNRKILDWLTG